MPDPFLVLATQNPIENEGVYPLPEAQRDRFLFKIIVDYPGVEEEREIVYRMGVEPPVAQQVIEPDGAGRGCRTSRRTCSCTTRWSTTWCGWWSPPARPAEHGLADVAGWVSYGASPRATLGIVAAARALALVRGRDYVLPAGRARRRARTCCGTGSCCPTTRSPTACRSTTSSAGVLATVPLPQVTPGRTVPAQVRARRPHAAGARRDRRRPAAAPRPLTGPRRGGRRRRRRCGTAGSTRRCARWS